MRIEIEIPKEFENDYKSDKFKDFFSRVLCDIVRKGVMCGKYEKETAEMFIKAFDESKDAYDVEKVVEQLQSQFGCKDCEYVDETDNPACIECCEMEVMNDICEIVRKGGVE